MKHTIEIEGLPEGWEPVAFRVPEPGEYFFIDGNVEFSVIASLPYLIVKKKQPRRIVLEETEEKHLGKQNLRIDSGEVITLYTGKVWREVKENDLSLNNEEPKLSLTVDECRSMSLSGISMKIADFLRDK